MPDTPVTLRPASGKVWVIGGWVRNFVRRHEISWPSIVEMNLAMSLRVVTNEATIVVAAAPGQGPRQYGRIAAMGRLAEGSPDVAHRVRAYWWDVRKRSARSAPLAQRVKTHWLGVELSILGLLVVAAGLAFSALH